MANRIEFTRNYSDSSTEQGFQFEFFCDRCGSGFRTRFKPWSVGTVSGVMDAASSLFGGVFGKAADVTDRVRSAAWETAHDQAFEAAMQELKPDFMQCPRCSSWVCRKSCWNAQRGLCKECAPDTGVEMAAAQAARTRDKIWEAAEIAEEDQQVGQAKSYKKAIRATCPNCDAPLSGNVKFCPECGSRIQASAQCTECGTKLQPGAKFCPECGAKVK